MSSLLLFLVAALPIAAGLTSTVCHFSSGPDETFTCADLGLNCGTLSTGEFVAHYGADSCDNDVTCLDDNGDEDCGGNSAIARCQNNYCVVCGSCMPHNGGTCGTGETLCGDSCNAGCPGGRNCYSDVSGICEYDITCPANKVNTLYQQSLTGDYAKSCVSCDLVQTELGFEHFCGTFPRFVWERQPGIETYTYESTDCGSCPSGQECVNYRCQDECTSVCGDPHFTGLDGVRYTFQGEPGKTFALLSDQSVQLNSQFVPHEFKGHTNTFLGSTCLRSCNETVVFHPNRTIEINGHHITADSGHRGSGHSSHSMKLDWMNHHLVKVTIPGRWVLKIDMLDNRININKITPLGEHDRRSTHGVFGHTIHKPHVSSKHHVKCNSDAEGGCEVDGHFRDYEVPGDLCSTRWTHATFDAVHACK